MKGNNVYKLNELDEHLSAYLAWKPPQRGGQDPGRGPGRTIRYKALVC